MKGFSGYMYNLDKLIEQIKQNLGCAPDQIELIEKIKRFDVEKKKDKAGWYIGNVWNYDGKDYAAASYGSWKDLKGPYSWKSWDKKDELESPGLRKSIKNLNIKKDAELKKESLEAKEEILTHFEHFKSVKEDNFYLTKKQIGIKKGLLEDKYGSLIVPVYENTKKDLAGYQRILNQEKYNKQFPEGQAVQGNFYFFGNLKTAPFIYLAEGMATAATVYEVTGVPCVVAFQANNIPNVVRKIKHELNGIKIVIAADNDQLKTNAGMYYAKKAKDKSGNVGIIMPSFPKGSTLTDFNDFFITQGEELTKDALYYDESNFVEVEFLGYDNSKYYFYSTRSKDIRGFTTEKLKSGSLIELAKENYWSQKYFCRFDKEGEPIDACDWKKTTEKIIEEQNKIGMFSGGKVRGVGSWIDKSNHIINTGEKLFLNGEEINFGKNRVLSKFYIPSADGEILRIAEKKMHYDFMPLVKAFDLVDFASQKDRIFILGYLAVAQIFTTQRWRPHIWVRADKGTGKSSLLEFCAEFLMNSILFQDSTSAGVRQKVRMDSKICLIDEAEGESHKTKQLVELARQSSSGGDTTIVRGTVSGSVLEYKPEMSFFFASIRAAELTPADKSRIVELSMKKPLKTCGKANKKREDLLYESLKLREDLFKYMNDNLAEFKSKLAEVKRRLNLVQFNNREADQYGPLIAGYHMLNPEADLNEVIFDALKEASEDRDEDQDSDQHDFLDFFTNLIFKRKDKEQQTLRSMIKIHADNINSSNRESEMIENYLETYGIYFLKKKGYWLFSDNHNLKKLTKDSKYKDYASQMKNNKYFKKDRNSKKRGYSLSKLAVNVIF